MRFSVTLKTDSGIVLATCDDGTVKLGSNTMSLTDLLYRCEWSGWNIVVHARVLGFDPGEDYTGWAFVTEGKVQKLGELPGWKGVDRLIEQSRPNVIVAESFVLYPGKAKSLSGNKLRVNRVLGVMEFLAEKQGITFIEQPASRIRHDPLVKFIKHHKSRHANDAAKHAMAYWYKEFTLEYKGAHGPNKS